MSRTADWIAVVTAANPLVYLMSMPNRVCFQYSFETLHWHYVPGLMLPPLTFLLCEEVEEKVGVQDGGSYKGVFHVIDVRLLVFFLHVRARMVSWVANILRFAPIVTSPFARPCTWGMRTCGRIITASG